MLGFALKSRIEAGLLEGQEGYSPQRQQGMMAGYQQPLNQQQALTNQTLNMEPRQQGAMHTGQQGSTQQMKPSSAMDVKSVIQTHSETSTNPNTSSVRLRSVNLQCGNTDVKGTEIKQKGFRECESEVIDLSTAKYPIRTYGIEGMSAKNF